MTQPLERAGSVGVAMALGDVDFRVGRGSGPERGDDAKLAGIGATLGKEGAADEDGFKPALCQVFDLDNRCRAPA